MHKVEKFKYVSKVWGQEIWLVNCPEYCSKILLLNEGAKSSWHYHRKKKETFYAFEGLATLNIEGHEYTMAPFTHAKTIEPYTMHSFFGRAKAVLLEISTHHDEKDVVRIDESRVGTTE